MSISSLPVEIRIHIFTLCKTNTLSTLSLINKQFYKEATPLLWKQLDLRWSQMENEIDLESMNNVKYTTKLRFGDNSAHNLKIGLTSFNFGFIVRKCDSQRMLSLCIQDFTIYGALNLASLTFPHLQSLHCRNIGEEFAWNCLDRFVHLRDLRLNICTVTDAHLIGLPNMIHLTILELKNCLISVDIVEKILQLEDLKHLLLDQSNSFHKQFYKDGRNLGNLCNLEWLDCPLLGGEALTLLTHTCKKLKYLQMKGRYPSKLFRDKIYSKSLSFIHKLEDLRELHITSCKIDDTCLLHISKLTGLKVLDIHNCFGVTNAGILHISKLVNIEHLKLDDTDIDNTSLFHISKLESLQILNLQGCDNVGDEGIRYISELCSIQMLLLDSTMVSDMGLELISIDNKLTHLDLGYCQVTDIGMEKVSRFKFLRVLRLCGDDDSPLITDIGLQYISELTQLEDLDIAGSKVTDQGFAVLSKLTSLIRLRMPYLRELTDESLKVVSQFPLLQALDICSCNFTDAGLGYIAELKSLQVFSWENEYEEEGVTITEAGIKKYGLDKLVPNEFLFDGWNCCDDRCR